MYFLGRESFGFVPPSGRKRNSKDSILLLKEGRLKHLHFFWVQEAGVEDTDGLMGLMGANREA